MKKLLLALVALAFMPAAWACDTYTSTAKEPGARILVDEWTDLTVREGEAEKRYTTGSAGTGTGIRVAFPEGSSEAVEIKQTEGEYWLGEEKFVAYCN